MTVKTKRTEAEMLAELEKSQADKIAGAQIVRGATSKPVAFRASAPLMSALDQLAQEEHRTRASLITHILWQYVHRERPSA